MKEEKKEKKTVISESEALAAVRRNDGSARAAAEEVGVSFKTMCRRINSLGLERAVIIVHPKTRDNLPKLSASDWDLIESTVADMAESRKK